MTEQSCNCYSRVVVPLYDTLGPEAVSYIINLGESPPSFCVCVWVLAYSCFSATISVAVCHESKISLLLKQSDSCPSLRTIIKIGGEVTAEEKQKAADIGLDIYSFQKVEVRPFSH